MYKLIIKVKTKFLLQLKSKTIKNKYIFSFENCLEESFGIFKLKAEINKDVLETKIYLNNQEIDNFYLADHSTYFFTPKLCDVAAEYTITLKKN